MIIGLSGYARSGKDEIAKVLVDNYGFTRIAFADKIREFLYETNPIIDNYYRLRSLVDAYGWDTVKENPQVRQLLQNVGVAARTVFSDEFWIAQALLTIDSGKNWVITDVRFSNEAHRVKQYDNSHLWRVNRSGVEAVNNHVSEHDLNNWKFDYIVNNEGSLAELKTLVQEKMSTLLHAN